MCTVLQKVTHKCGDWENRDLDCSKYFCAFSEFGFRFVLFF